MNKSKYPVIFSILSALGVVGTTFLAIKATDNAQKELHDDSLYGADKFMAVAPHYVPTLISGLCTIGFIFVGGHLNKKQQLSFVSAYEMAATSLRQYRNQVVSRFGPEVDEDIVISIEAEEAQKVPLTGSTFVGDNCLCLDGVHEERVVFYDTMSKRYFSSTIGNVLQAEYHLNRNYALGAEIPLNMFYEFLGIDNVDPGDYIGWGWGLAEDGICWIDFNHTKVTNKDGSIYYRIDPLFSPMPLVQE